MSTIPPDRIFLSARAVAGLTQAEAAEQAGIDASTVARIERGEATSTKKATALARVLGMSDEDLGRAMAATVAAP